MPTSSTITVAAGKVGSDLTNFPMMIDLADMPTAFWLDVRSDGFNIRVQDATNTDIPFDLVKFDYTNHKGYMFAKVPTIATASDTDINVLTTSDTALPAVTDSNGRNAVWSDYSRVVMAEDTTTDRTGSGVTIVNTAASGWLTESISPNLSLSNPQGVAAGNSNFWTSENNVLKRYDSTWTLQTTNSNPIGAAGLSVNHIGGIFYEPGADELFMVAENYPAGTYNNQYVLVFDATALTYKRQYNISAQLRETSAIALNPADGNWYITDFTNGASIAKYDSSFSYLGTLALTTTINSIQGICFLNGSLFLMNNSSTTGQKGLVEINPSTGALVAPRHNMNLCATEPEAIHASEDGLAILALTSGDNTTGSRVRRMRLGPDAAQGFFGVTGDTSSSSLKVPAPTLNVWTIGVTYRPEQQGGATNHGIISYTVDGSTADANRATMADRGSSPRQLNHWNSTNSWPTPSTVVTPAALTKYRCAFAYNNTSARKMFVNGVSIATPAATAVRPPAATTDAVYIGASTSPSEVGVAGFGAFYLRASYLSDDWLAAEGSNWVTPNTFYTVPGGGSTTELRVTSLSEEVIRQMNPTERVTSIATEVIRKPQVDMRVTSLAVEVIRKVSSAPSSRQPVMLLFATD